METTEQMIEAVKSGNLEVAQTLLQQNPALINSKTNKGETLLLLALYYRKQNLLSLLRSYKTTLSIYEASAIGSLEDVRQILQATPYQLDSYSDDGFTPLGLACFFGQREVVEFLISKGSAVNLPSKNAFKVRPIHSAVSARHLEIVRLLLRQGADANARQMQGVSPLHQSAHNGDLEISKLLLKYGANPDAKNDDEKTPLTFALESNAQEIVELIKEADRNTPTAC